MTHSVSPDIEALEKLLDGLISEPVKTVIADQLKSTQRQLKSLSSELNDLEEASKKRQQQVVTELDGLARRVDALAYRQEQWQREWREAHAAVVHESKERDEAAVLSRHRQLNRLSLLAPVAGLLSAAAVELIDHLL